MRLETDGSQAQPAPPQRAVEAPPLGLTERGKAALEQARRGEAQPAEGRVIDIGALPSGPSTNGPEDNEPQPDTPALGTSFEGMADTGWFPPDHQIAAGPNNIVVATNGGVNILSKRGTALSSQTLGGFFSPLGSEHSGAFDPWLVYDPYINRFWLMAVSRDTTTQRSDIVIALSNTQDATLGWTMWELSGSVNGGTNTTNWCDYPKLGFDSQAIYVTCNMFAFSGGFQYSKLRILNKTQFVNNTAIFWWDFWDIREGGSGTTTAFTIQPAAMYGATASTGGFLVNARGGGGTGSTLDVWRVPNPLECCNGDAVGPTLNNQGHGVAGYGPSDGARQPGTSTQINNGDSRLLYAVWKNGRLSTGHTVACGTDACGGFTELNVASYPTITTLNNWILTAGGADVYYPAASVNNADDKTMVYTVSDSTLSPSAAYVGIPSSADCTTCVDGGTNIMRFGENSNGYVRLDTQNRNRWGDYSGASPDPNGEGIWVVGEFAAATDDTWGVQTGLTYQTAPPPANDDLSGAQSVSGTSASVNGTNRYASRQVGEPNHWSTSAGEHSVWYSWTAPSSGQVELNTCTSSFDTVLAVYTGSSFGTMSQVASNDDACGTNGSQLIFNATAGTTYRIAVSGFFSTSEGTFTLQVIDKTPPRVSGTKPANNATGVAAGANVIATFSEAMDASTSDGDASTINGTTFKLKRAGTTTFLGATVTYNTTTRKATLNPNNNLRSGVTYQAIVTTGAQDLAGNALDQNASTAGNQQKSWKFKVG
jgi:Bacterial Ig-like domain